MNWVSVSSTSLILAFLTPSPQDVLATFYDVRVDFYGKRKNHLLSTLTDAWEKLDNKVRLSVVVAVSVTHKGAIY